MAFYRQDLAKSYNELGAILAGTGRAADAEAAYREAMKLYQQLIADNATAPIIANELAYAMVNLADFLLRSKKPDLARQLLEQAVPRKRS